MGQGYKAIILGSPADAEKGEKEFIRTWVDSHAYGNGYKLMEHGYIRNHYVEAVEYMLSPLGMFHKSRLVWAGDYADKEPGLDENLNDLTGDELNEGKMSTPVAHSMASYPYVVNHSRREYFSKTCTRRGAFVVHPLPLLTAEGNGRGGGDYDGVHEELAGTWARDVISVEKEIPADYTERVFDFHLSE